MKDNLVCAVCGKSSSESRVRKCSLYGDYLCGKHELQFRKYGTILERTKRDPNEFIVEGNVCKITLYDKTNQLAGCAVIDVDDMERCKQYKWKIVRSNKTCYAATRLPSSKTISLHRFVLGYEGNQAIDHINRNGLDNRKCNLRIVDGTTNNLNKSSKDAKKAYNGYYTAKFRAEGIDYMLGYYATENEASVVSELCRLQYIDDKEYFIQSYNLIKMIDSEKDPNRNIHQTPSGSYVVKFGFGKRLYHIGTYKTTEQARIARDKFEKERNEYPLGKEAFDTEFFKKKKECKQYSGISKAPSGRWRVNASLNGKCVYVGTYDTLEEAVQARSKVIAKNESHEKR